MESMPSDVALGAFPAIGRHGILRGCTHTIGTHKNPKKKKWDALRNLHQRLDPPKKIDGGLWKLCFFLEGFGIGSPLVTSF